MREDMHKVIGQRPRVGGGWIKLKNSPDFSEDATTHEAMRPKVGGYNLKRKHDHRAPLRRYLNSQVGRQWNDVYSDICLKNDHRGKTQRDLLELVAYMVHDNVTMVEGEPRAVSGFSIWRDFWVHPDTGALMAAPQHKRYRWRGFKKNFEQVDADSTHKYVKINNIWFLVSFAPFDRFEFEEAKKKAAKDFRLFIHDVVFREELPGDYDSARRKLEHEWGAAVFASAKRQLGKRQVRKVNQMLARIKSDRES